MSARFLTPLRVEIDRRARKNFVRLTEPLIFETSWGQQFEVPVGFWTDMASVPPFGRPVYSRLEADTASAAVLHDWLLATACVPRWFADGIFFEGLKASGASPLKCTIMWAGVRAWGIIST